MDYQDQPTTIRKGEELDSAGVEAFLRETIPKLQGEMIIRQFHSGHSNLTYLVTFGDRQVVLRRPPFGTKAKTAHDMGREYRILSALKDIYQYGPEPLAYTEDNSIIGCPFYIMERIEGIIVHREFPSDIMESPDNVRALCRKLIEVQYELHSIDFAKLGLTISANLEDMLTGRCWDGASDIAMPIRRMPLTLKRLWPGLKKKCPLIPTYRGLFTTILNWAMWFLTLEIPWTSKES